MIDFTKLQSPVIIAGPCSAESKEQLFQTAESIKNIPNISLFRAGIWKPRTSPGKFEGHGETALKWLSEVKQQYNIPVCTEVASPQHVELALKYHIDVVWIGARTTTNPFSVNEIASALQNVQIPIMIKNPMHPEIKLWIGAIERIMNVGINNIAAIHRGFFYYGNDQYRNKPLWQIPLELKTQFPDIPIICDPSHIAGKKEYLFEISQKALNIGMNGLMIETHINPSIALSDKEQQITPSELKILLSKLKFLDTTSDDPLFKNTLDIFRQIIDEIDEDILNLIARRFDVVQQIALYKKEKNVMAFQLSRWKEILKNRKTISKELNISEHFIHHFLSLLHEESINIQNKILNQNDTEPITHKKTEL
ncbi:MAG: bifunctional 3-deoxy-7-phosphoheptulonate synthase/chorismate mutase type II [Bacteroidia bacterium]|nr:bifunctional 3-deoxy-7-phosphoheptulonate synthase/chorismate mutase type II [Bacteroidia bacterium]